MGKDDQAGEGALPLRAQRLLDASRAPGCPVSFDGAQEGPATAMAAEEQAVSSGHLTLSLRALAAVAAGIESIERSVAKWADERAVNSRERASAIAYWRAQLPFLSEDGSVDDRAYLDALAAAAWAPAPETGSSSDAQESFDAMKAASDAGWQAEQLARQTARRAPSESADALLRAEGAGGIMPPASRAELLPDRSELLAGRLAGEPAWLWSKQARREVSPEPLAPPLWESAPAFAATTWRRLAEPFAAACEDGAEGVPGWADGARAWADGQRELWAAARFDAEAAWEAACAVGLSAAREAACGAGCGEGLPGQALSSLEDEQGREELARCIASAMCAALARGMPESMRARAPDARAPRPLTSERMRMLAGANPAKPWF